LAFIQTHENIVVIALLWYKAARSRTVIDPALVILNEAGPDGGVRGLIQGAECRINNEKSYEFSVFSRR